MNSIQETKTTAIAAIVEQMRLHQVSLAELADALKSGDAPRGKRDIAARLFSTLGGILVFAGVGVYISTFWHEMNTPMRIIATLGVGIVVQALAVLTLRDGRLPRVVMPLLVIAFIMQPTGWFVAIHEFFPNGHEPRYAILFVMTIMAVQQIALFLYFRLTPLLLAALFFSYAAAFTMLDLMDANEKLVLAGMGVSMMALAQYIRITPHASLSPLGYLIGGTCFYAGLFELLENTPFELLYIGAVAGLIYLSTSLRSATLLVVSTIALLAYIGYFTEKHFVHSVGWPLSLVALGIAFFAISGFAFRVKRQYINK